MLKRSAGGGDRDNRCGRSKGERSKAAPRDYSRDAAGGYLANTDSRQPCRAIDYREADAISLSGDFKSTLFKLVFGLWLVLFVNNTTVKEVDLAI